MKAPPLRPLLQEAPTILVGVFVPASCSRRWRSSNCGPAGRTFRAARAARSTTLRLDHLLPQVGHDPFVWLPCGAAVRPVGRGPRVGAVEQATWPSLYGFSVDLPPGGRPAGEHHRGGLVATELALCQGVRSSCGLDADWAVRKRGPVCCRCRRDDEPGSQAFSRKDEPDQPQPKTQP